MKNDSYKRLLTDIINADLFNAIENYNLSPCGYYDGETCSSCPSPDIDFAECHKAMLQEIKFRIECLEKQKERKLINLFGQDEKQLVLTDIKELKEFYADAYCEGQEDLAGYEDSSPRAISGWECNEDILSAV